MSAVPPRWRGKVLTDMHRGEGLMLRKGVRELLLRREKNRFMKEEWPALRSRMKRLGIDLRSLAADCDG